MPTHLKRDEQIARGIDWVTVLIYALLVTMGWFNIYAAVLDPEIHHGISHLFDLNLNSGKQLLWIGTAVIIITAILTIDYKFYDNFAYLIYGVLILALLAVLSLGAVVSGSKSWFQIGSFRLQPAEFAKFATALALARYLSMPNVRLDRTKYLLQAAGIVAVPALLVLLQNDTGSMLVFAAFMIVLFREGLNPIFPIMALGLIALLVLSLLVPQEHYHYIAIGIAVLAAIFMAMVPKRLSNMLQIGGLALVMIAIVYGVDFFINNVLQPHQQIRLKVLVDPSNKEYALGAGWNVTQSKIAIGSGGLFGKGFLMGTQTKFDFVPEQSTDFIFCTIGEEHGFIGSTIVIGLFIFLLMRIIFLAERQRSAFGRVYGYGVASIFFFHFMINVGMTLGVLPVIGIPLPFFSYGGSSLWAFTILLFILLKLDAHRGQVLHRGG